MSEEKKPLDEWYQRLKGGYQPEPRPAVPSGPVPEGYQPEINGDTQNNQPTPPIEE